MRQPLPPVVLVLAGHDPTGGAGLVADSAVSYTHLTLPTIYSV